MRRASVILYRISRTNFKMVSTQCILPNISFAW